MREMVDVGFTGAVSRRFQHEAGGGPRPDALNVSLALTTDLLKDRIAAAQRRVRRTRP